MKARVHEVPSCSYIVALRARREAERLADHLQDERRWWVVTVVLLAVVLLVSLAHAGHHMDGETVQTFRNKHPGSHELLLHRSLPPQGVRTWWRHECREPAYSNGNVVGQCSCSYRLPWWLRIIWRVEP